MIRLNRLFASINRTSRSLAGTIALPLLCLLLVGSCSAGREDTSTGSVAMSGNPEPGALQQTQWQVVRINSGPVVAGSAPTIILNEGEQFGGDTSCNRYFGQWSVSGSSASFETAGVTRRACEPALMTQETDFLDALASITRVERSADGNLSLMDADGASRLELVAVDSATSRANTDVPQDWPGSAVHRFECENFGAVTFRIVGPDTIELQAENSRFVLSQRPAASGARYSAEGTEFWNKGDEALLVVGDRRYSCMRASQD